MPAPWMHSEMSHPTKMVSVTHLHSDDALRRPVLPLLNAGSVETLAYLYCHLTTPSDFSRHRALCFTNTTIGSCAEPSTDFLDLFICSSSAVLTNLRMHLLTCQPYLRHHCVMSHLGRRCMGPSASSACTAPILVCSLSEVVSSCPGGPAPSSSHKAVLCPSSCCTSPSASLSLLSRAPNCSSSLARPSHDHISVAPRVVVLGSSPLGVSVARHHK